MPDWNWKTQRCLARAEQSSMLHCLFLRFYLFEKHWLPLPHPQPGTWPTTQACVLTRNQTSDILVPKPALNSLSHTSQGCAASWLSCNTIELFCSCVVLQLSCLHWIKFPSWLHPKLRIPTDVGLAPMISLDSSNYLWCTLQFFFFKVFIVFIFRERGREGEREGEKH